MTLVDHVSAAEDSKLQPRKGLKAARVIDISHHWDCPAAMRRHCPARQGRMNSASCERVTNVQTQPKCNLHALQILVWFCSLPRFASQNTFSASKALGKPAWPGLASRKNKTNSTFIQSEQSSSVVLRLFRFTISHHRTACSSRRILQAREAMQDEKPTQ